MCKHTYHREMLYTPHPQDSRMIAKPTGRPDIWEFYEKAKACFWKPKEIVLRDERTHYETKLNEGERRCVDWILSFFVIGDQLINVNIVEYLRELFPIRDVQYFYDFQIMMENLHAETYADVADAVSPDLREQAIQRGWLEVGSIANMCAWIRAIIPAKDSAERLHGRTPARVLLKQACVEGIFFTSCFCVIYWLKSRGFMPGLGQSNELIARDEALHTDFALHLFRRLLLPEFQLETAEIYQIVAEAVDIATSFSNDMLQVDMPEMNKKLLAQYIQCVADCLLHKIDCPPLYKVTQPFLFMDQINMNIRHNFFEAVPTAYMHKIDNDATNLDFIEDF